MTAYLYFLIVHLSAFALFTGTLAANIITYQQLWSYWQTDIPVSKALIETTIRQTRLMGISLGIAIMAGIAMMSQMHQVYGAQSWIRVKIALVVILLILRVLSSRNSKRIKDKVFNKSIVSFASLKIRATIFQWIQLAVIAIIIILSIKKFN